MSQHNVNRCRMVICLILLLSLNLAGRIAQATPPQEAIQWTDGKVSNVKWSTDGKTLFYTSDGKRYQYDLTNGTRAEAAEGQDEKAQSSPRGRRGGAAASKTGTYQGRPSRGRQYTQVVSPDGEWLAEYKDWNVVLKNLETKEETAVTTEGNENIKFGTACWVYGEELRQTKAMWWSADSKKLLYYRFDDTDVKKFYLLRGWSEIGTELYPEYYPKAGAQNPAVSLYVYDLESKESKKIEAGGGSEEYIYGIRTSPDGKVMMLNWTDRLQRHLQVKAVDLETGKCRVVVEEKQTNWQTNSPPMRYL